MVPPTYLDVDGTIGTKGKGLAEDLVVLVGSAADGDDLG